MKSKFYIYASGRWREVEMDTGCVSGWGHPNFVFLRGGRLVMAQRTRVLRALRLLAAGRRSAAKESCKLSKYVPPPTPILKRWTKSPVHQHHITCRPLNDHTCARCNDTTFNRILKETNTVATQYVSTADASNQVTEMMILSPSPQNTGNQNSSSPKRALPARRKNGKFSKRNFINKLSLKNIEAKQGTKDTIETSTVAVMNKEHAPKRLNKKIESLNFDREQLITTETDKSREEIKELVIDDEVVEILRRYLKKNNLGFDIKKFDEDDAYKEHVFYKINPMVVAERCSRIKSMIERCKKPTRVTALPEFLNSLGLQFADKQIPRQKRYKTRSEVSNSQSIRSRSPQGSAHHNKENESIQNIVRNSQNKTDKLPTNSVLNGIKSKTIRSPPEKRVKKMTRQRQTEEIEPSNGSGASSSDDSSSSNYQQPNKVAMGSPPEKRVKKMTRQRQTEEIEPSDGSGASSSDSSGDSSSGDYQQSNNVAMGSEASAVRTRSITNTPSATAPRDKAVTAAPAVAKRPTAPPAPVATTAPAVTKRATAPSAPVATTARAAADSQVVINDRSSKNRGYSPLEDQTILSWVQKKDRARLVNGNRIWRELESEYAAKTSVARTWHSLRNRYLRSILPCLHNLAPSPVAVQLRAAAAAGEIKNQKKPVTSSILVMPRVRSAWAPHRARLASRSSSHDTPAPTHTSTPRDDPSSGSHSAERTKISKRSSVLKRKFQDVDSSQEERRELRPRPSEVNRRSGNPADSTMRVLREKPKKRRLYNPESVF